MVSIIQFYLHCVHFTNLCYLQIKEGLRGCTRLTKKYEQVVEKQFSAREFVPLVTAEFAASKFSEKIKKSNRLTEKMKKKNRGSKQL